MRTHSSPPRGTTPSLALRTLGFGSARRRPSASCPRPPSRTIPWCARRTRETLMEHGRVRLRRTDGSRVTARLDAGAGGHTGTLTGVIHSLSQWSDRFIRGGGRRSASVRPATPEPRPDRRPRRPARSRASGVSVLCRKCNARKRSAMEGRVLLRVSGSRGRLPAATTCHGGNPSSAHPSRSIFAQERFARSPRPR